MKVIDLHCDTLWLMWRDKEIHLKRNACCIDVEKLRVADSLAQFFACFVYKDWYQGERGYDEAYGDVFRMIKLGKQEVEANFEHLALAGDLTELQRNCQNGKRSAVFTLEEGGVLNGHLERLEQLYEAGIRLITLTWNYENCIGYPNSRELRVMQKGLKPFGIEVVERMNELGMMIDVSHLSDGGFWDVLKYSKRPFVASHSNARELCNHPRNLSDEMIKALAEKGGVVGVNFYPYFLNTEGKGTVENIAEHIMHMYKIGGEDVVAIGTDFDGFDEGESEVAHIGELEKVYTAVKKRGLTERQIEKIWSGNAMRVMKNCIK